MHKYNRAIIAHIGPMWGGKTSALTSDLKKMEYAKYNTCLFKPKKDNRYSSTKVVTHDGEEMDAINVETFQDIKNYIEQHPELNINVIGIDEFQFIRTDKVGYCFANDYIKSIDDLVKWIIDNKYTLIISGLDLSSEFEPFNNVKELLPYATHIIKHTAVCVDCGNDATISHCLFEKTEKEFVGAKELYIPLCLNCYLERKENNHGE